MNHTTQTILGTLIVIGFVMGALFLYERSEKNEAVAEPSTTAKTYQNSDHGFTLSYPTTLDILEYTDDMTSIGTLIEGGIASAVDVRVVIIQGEEGESFIDAAARNLAELCAADGPDTSFSCTGIERSSPFVSGSGAIGLEVYLTGELTSASATETVQKGPFYVFLIQGDASASKVLIVHAPLSLSASESDVATIRNVAESVVFTEQPTEAAGIEDYIADNISTLSTKPEQLGGTFYVTRIEAKNGSGVVSYEDGHNAYTADFTYSLSASGSFSVDSFVVRP